jgi:hypothetical protein
VIHSHRCSRFLTLNPEEDQQAAGFCRRDFWVMQEHCVERLYVKKAGESYYK